MFGVSYRKQDSLVAVFEDEDVNIFESRHFVSHTKERREILVPTSFREPKLLLGGNELNPELYGEVVCGCWTDVPRSV